MLVLFQEKASERSSSTNTVLPVIKMGSSDSPAGHATK